MIIYLETLEIQLQDIPRVLNELGYTIKNINLQISAQGFDQEACDKIKDVLSIYKPKWVISYDFSESISQACMEENVPYIAWVYDNPQQEIYTRYAHNPNNYIFVFDKQQQKYLKQTGIKHVYHMPLAVHGDKIRLSLQQGRKCKQEYEAEVSFVGQLYRIKSLETIIEQADARIQEEMETSISSCLLNWNPHIKITGKLTNTCVEYFSKTDGYKIARCYPYVSEQFYYEAAVLSRILANRERVTILNHLAEKYDVKFYTFDKDVSQLSEAVKVCQGAKYDMEVSNVYRQTKINLNITLHCIETGIPQRVFDVMAAGGFLLSNYQEELEELFVDGEDLVIYHNLEELERYVGYYLTHEEERQRIAKNGQEKVLKYHDLHTRMEQVIKIVTDVEGRRLENYLTLWHRSQPEIDMMKELALCHNLEIKLGLSKVLQGINNLEDAKEKYYDVRSEILKLHDNCGTMQYRHICQVILEKQVSGLYPVYLIYTNYVEKERVLVDLCEHMKQSNIATAIEVISYGAIMMQDSSIVLVKKAECLMEVSMWKEALDTLKQIQKPQEEIISLIKELELIL